MARFTFGRGNARKLVRLPVYALAALVTLVVPRSRALWVVGCGIGLGEGLNQQFTYKGFDASLFVNFVLGNDIYNANKIEFTSNTANTAFNNLLDITANRYRLIEADGSPITSLERLQQVNQNASIWTPTRNLLLHSWAIENGSFLRLNNITVGYTLPKTLTAKAKITTLRFYVTLNNLYTFTSYSGYDPEVNTRRATPLTPGVDYAAYPRSRAFLAGVNLAF